MPVEWKYLTRKQMLITPKHKSIENYLKKISGKIFRVAALSKSGAQPMFAAETMV